MLQKLREQTQGTGFKILVGAIIVVLTLFGFGATNLFMGGDPELAQVGSFSITQNQLATETERERQRLLSQMGPDFDPSNIDRLQLQEYVLQQLINRQVLYQATDELGIAVSPETVNDELINSPAYQVDGQFNEAIYRQQLRALGYTPLSFVEEFSNALSAETLQAGVYGSVSMPDWELAEIVRIISQRRDIAYLPLTVEQFSENVEVTEDEVTLRYNENQSDYMTPLTVDVSYLQMSAEDLVDDSSIEITEADLLSLYEDERALALADEQRDSAHILIQINQDRSDAEALAAITDIQNRIAAGEDFSELAKQYSEDAGSAVAGGDLGPAGKGIFDPAFENALWNLQEPDDISEPVLTNFGYHLIQLKNIVVPEYPEFDTMKEQLTLRAREIQAQDLFIDKALELERAAYDERFSLDNTAATMGLSVTKVPGVSQSGGNEDPLLNDPAINSVLFSSEVLEGTNSDAVELNDTQIVVVRVDKQYEPEPLPLDQVADEIRGDLVREKALAAIEAAKAEGMQRLSAGESVTEIARDLGSRWLTFELAARANSGQNIPNAVLEAAFDLARPLPGKKSVGMSDLPDGAALITVTRVIQGDPTTTTDAEIEQLRQVAENRAARLDFQGLFEAARQQLGVKQPAS
ncbi:MAG: SurA N-terminal domain-containing protein [Pseudomonadales bacterium]|jgi:peptidyl-prolyl cis-trans isomerase D|nr:SurA N-terminal domain-containing protein [Pseudomonadales bacterium]